MNHVPVLLHETIEGLAIKEGAVIVDGTLGAGGHSSEIAKKFGKNVTIVGFDLDQSALDLAASSINEAGGKLIPIHSNFRTIETALPEKGIKKIDGAMFDLGISSMEIGASGRGFSFKYDEPLLMTLQNPITEETLTAMQVVNSTREEELANIIFEYGEEHFSRGIAKAIVQARKIKKIETSLELAEIIANAVPGFYKKGRINPATKTFQALRIYVNDELGAVKEGLQGAWNLLAPQGRIAVITFHSLEDRIVKNFFRDLPKEQKILHTKKPIVPTREEIIKNPRSRSAKLRIIEKI
ncbi:MAG: 16S rRNA (cytosine(1402)-N(4))-methyltransferase RsmH [Candidatus Pacebacteria bacterium]|nr:16S rRNA (cytosine(1402)-N(4))-methyltransferase RsmH [Candidatus Paceibacterota bacterium]